MDSLRFRSYETALCLEFKNIEQYIKDNRFIYGEHNIKLGNRFKTFLTKEPNCQFCRLPVTHIAVQKYKHNNKWHLNAWSNQLLMTSDHVVPKSLGGTDDLNNRQVLCERCNAKKGNNLTGTHRLQQHKIITSQKDAISYLEDLISKCKSNDFKSLNLQYILHCDTHTDIEHTELINTIRNLNQKLVKAIKHKEEKPEYVKQIQAQIKSINRQIAYYSGLLGKIL